MPNSPDETTVQDALQGSARETVQDDAPGERSPSPSSSSQKRAGRREGLDRDSLLIVAVQGMHSHACEDKIVRSLNAVDGVRETEVDFPSGQASVIYDARRTTAHQLLEAVGVAGYRVGDYFLGRG